MASRKVIRRKPGRAKAGLHPNQEPRRAPGPSAPAAWLAIADATALILFVLAGMRSHDQGTLVGNFVRNAIPLLGAWFLVAAIFRTYRRRGLKVVVQTWIVAVPIGLVVRSMWVGSPQGGRIFVFLAVGLGFTMLFLLAGRAVVALVSGRGYPQGRSAGPPPV
jgi:hypothetical protein